MRFAPLLLALLPFPAPAAPFLSPSAPYKVKKEIQELGVAPKAPESFYSEMQMDFESFDPNDSSGYPLMSTHTDQRMKVRRLPKLDAKDPAAPKDGYNDRVELTFERLLNSSKVRVPGLSQPFETKSDLGAALATRPLLIRSNSEGNKKIDNLDQIRAEVLAKASDPIARTSISTLLSENILLKAGAAVGQDSSCLSGFGRKKPGEKWHYEHEEQGVRFDYACEFDGWSEEQGRKVAVIHVHADKQRTTRAQPNGTPGVAETEGDGHIYYEPKSSESLMRMETKITVEPAEEELNRLKAKGQTIPRNRSLMTHWNHVFKD